MGSSYFLIAFPCFLSLCPQRGELKICKHKGIWQMKHVCSLKWQLLWLVAQLHGLLDSVIYNKFTPINTLFHMYIASLYVDVHKPTRFYTINISMGIRKFMHVLPIVTICFGEGAQLFPQWVTTTNIPNSRFL